MNAPTHPDQARRLARAERQAAVVRALAPLLPAHALLWQPRQNPLPRARASRVDGAPCLFPQDSPTG